MTKKFVIVIDAQYDFMMPKGKLYVQDAEQTIVPGIEFLEQLKPEDTEGVLFTFDTHQANTYFTMPESQQFPIHCELFTPGWHNVFNSDLVQAAIPTYTLTKGVFNMWEEPKITIESTMGGNFFTMDREKFFNQLKEDGVETVVVMGVAADFCVKWAVDGLVERGFNVEIPANLTRGIVRAIHYVVKEDFADKNVVII